MLTRIHPKLIFAFLLGWIYVMYEYAVRVSDSVILPQLQHSLHISALQIGLLSSVYYFSYVLWMIPAGIIIDRLGLYRAWVISLSLLIVGCVLFALRIDFGLMLVARIMMGIGSSYALIGVFAMAVSRPNTGILIGITMAILNLGGVVGQGPWLQVTYWLGNWTVTYWAAAVFGFLLLFFWFIFGDNLAKETTVKRNYADILATFKALFTSRVFWFLAIFVGALCTPQSAFMALWGPRYLALAYHVSATIAAYINSAIAIGSIAGGVAFGLLFDKCKYIRSVLILSGILTVILMIMIMEAWFQSEAIIESLMLLIGFITTANVMVFAIMGKNFYMHSRNTVQGATSMVNAGGGPVMQLVVGLLIVMQVKQIGDQLTLPVMHNALWSIPIVIAAATILLFFLPKLTHEATTKA